MSVKSYILLILSVETILYGCSQTMRGGDSLSLGEMQKRPVVFEAVNNQIDLNRNDALENYRAYISDSENMLYYGNVLKRIAALELEQSETAGGQSVEQQKSAGERALRSAIEHYNSYLQLYPDKKDNDHVLYQLAKAYSFNGEIEKTLSTFDEIIRDYPQTVYTDEIQFRRGEILFVFGDYSNAEESYSKIVVKATAMQYLERAQYKLAWSQFKQAKYIASLNNCIALLDRKQAQGKLADTSVLIDITRREREFIDDVLRVVSLSLSYKDGTNTIRQMLSGRSDRQYEPLIYRKLGEHYFKAERTVDAANVYLDYAKLYPNTLLAAEFHILAIKAYATGDFAELNLAVKDDFVRNFGVGTPFWLSHAVVNRQSIETELKASIHDLANHYHAIALNTGKPKDYINASIWYGEYIRSFPEDPDTAQMNFLLAESQYDAGLYRKALKEYVTTAYDYSLHGKSAESGYAAVLTYNVLIEQGSKHTGNRDERIVVAQLKADALQNAIRFSFQFKNSKHAPAVIANTAEKLYQNKDYAGAKEFSMRNAHLKNLPDKSHFRTTWLVYAHSLFELQEFSTAEQAYSSSLELIPVNDKIHKGISEKLAASIYMQGRLLRDKKQYELASYHFMRVGQVVPTSTILATAQYDAAAIQIRLESWGRATSILEDFRKRFPSNKKYSKGVTEKLVLSYTRTGQTRKAADEIYSLSLIATNSAERRGLTWQAAETYQQAGANRKSNKIYIAYVNKYPDPFAQNIEARQRVIVYYRENKAPDSLKKWQASTVKAEKLGKSERTERTRFIAASAALELAGPLVTRFKQATLTVPLKKSLKIKKKLMKNALKSYSDLMEYKIADTTTASTYHVADIYGHFAEALIKSQRPRNLNQEELEQYDILLEEQAYPFEEKSIDIHSLNAKRTSDGFYDIWIKKSIKALSILEPIRYAKNERVEIYVANSY